jgi:type IV fimbrial biogenesis protein FimT
MNPNLSKTMCCSLRPCAGPRGFSGFTLIELMVTVAVAVILATVATPSMRDLMLSNTASTMSNEFSTALAQARGLAIANNTCATLCTAQVTATNNPTCQEPGSAGYQEGWIVFTNPACDADQTDPTTAGARLRQAKNAGSSGYSIVASDDSLYRVMFDPRGISTATVAGRFQVRAPDDAANKYARTVCLDAAGRALVRRYSTTCN